ncbi:hypothetical protein H6F76_21875 [Leptolyngbya sp. FACHB-321]|uniref:hypothetical protein n=1 Tax=Leptolyngbya sp. FACHB-321 TaxID=2692807 RepID=UPI001686F6F2|nr:hypothetical protein [Leptolyngbya sp. FACHB-321]MBD2037614.1 hypothetical protein [Leptolyngbya sp. FACHB-321]
MPQRTHMTELVRNSTERSPDAAVSAASLLLHYGFDLGGDTIAPLLSVWQAQYPEAWIRLATIEALYQGRYKAISVEQILALWQRRSQPVYHFNHEFERLVCDRLPHTPESLNPSSQEELFLTPAAQALVATVPYPVVALPLCQSEPTVLHNADAMQALRNLQGDTTIDSPSVDRVAVSTAAPNEPSLVQTYSYMLRSDEPSPQPLAYAQTEGHAQTTVDSALLPSALPPSESAAQVAIDDTAQAGLIEATSARSDVEQACATDHATTATNSVTLSNGAQMQTPSSQAASITRILQQLDNQELSAKTMFPGFGLLAHTLQPKLRLHLTARYQPLWLTDPSDKQPIHQFTPAPEASDFHSKLKAVAQPHDEAPAVEP